MNKFDVIVSWLEDEGHEVSIALKDDALRTHRVGLKKYATSVRFWEVDIYCSYCWHHKNPKRMMPWALEDPNFFEELKAFLKWHNKCNFKNA